MWADTVDLKVGKWRVGVRTDSLKVAAAVRELAAPLLLHDPSATLPANFSIRGAHRWPRRQAAQLYIAGTLAFEDAHTRSVLNALAAYLSSIDVDPGDNCWVPGQIFVRDGDAVICISDRLSFGETAALRSAGVRELAALGALVDCAAASVSSPRLLPQLSQRHSSGADISTKSVQLRGIVVGPKNGSSTLLFAWEDASGDREGWKRLITTLKQKGRLATVDQRPELVGSIKALLAARVG